MAVNRGLLLKASLSGNLKEATSLVFTIAPPAGTEKHLHGLRASWATHTGKISRAPFLYLLSPYSLMAKTITHYIKYGDFKQNKTMRQRGM